MKVKKFAYDLPNGTTAFDVVLNDFGDKAQGSVMYQVDTPVVSLSGWILSGRLHSDAPWVTIVDHTADPERLQMIARVPQYRLTAVNGGTASTVAFYLGL